MRNYSRALLDSFDRYHEDEKIKRREVAMQNAVDDEVVRQVLSTSDDDVLAGKWPPLVQSVTKSEDK